MFVTGNILKSFFAEFQDVVGIATRLGTGISGVRIPAEIKDLSLLQTSSELTVGPNQSSVGTEGISVWVKLP